MKTNRYYTKIPVLLNQIYAAQTALYCVNSRFSQENSAKSGIYPPKITQYKD